MYKTLIAEIGRLIKGALPFAIVDVDGSILMSYKQPQDAWNAGHKLIFVKAGTYAGQSITGKTGVRVVACGKVAFVGGTSSHGFNVDTCNDCTFEGLWMESDSGGGNAYDGLWVDHESYRCTFINCTVPQSDNYGFNIAQDAQSTQSYHVFIACRAGVGGAGIDADPFQLNGKAILVTSSVSNGRVILAATADNCSLTGSYVGGDITLSSGNLNSLIVGNMYSGTLTDTDGTATKSGNEAI